MSNLMVSMAKSSSEESFMPILQTRCTAACGRGTGVCGGVKEEAHVHALRLPHVLIAL